jgi:chromosome partitioning protein
MLAKQGLSVLLWDLDPQGGSSYFFNRENHNNNTHAKLFDRYITIYDVIHSTESYQIDVISNDALFTDHFLSRASKITALNYMNHELLQYTLREVEDDYDICIIDSSPGRFLLHDNIFYCADLLLIPNIPAPLSVYCNNMLMNELAGKLKPGRSILSFYNMVQAHKNLHKFYLEHRKDDTSHILENYVPFYAEIESITVSKESIFHQLKQFKTNIYYEKLWDEVCTRMQWSSLNRTKAMIMGMGKEVPLAGASITPADENTLPKTGTA